MSHEPQTGEDVATLRKQLAEMGAQLAALTRATGGVTLLPPDEVPLYEIGEGHFYSPDDVYYPAGTQIEDVTGSLVPNEHMIPLNPAAEARMIDYLSSLPQQGTPSHEFVIDAAFKLLPQLSGMGDTPEARASINERILEEASRMRLKSTGLLPGGHEPRLPVRVPRRPGNVPLMSNTRIRQDLPQGSGAAQITPGPAPARGPVKTRQRSGPIAPANKQAPAMGTVASQTLGTVGPGVQS